MMKYIIIFIVLIIFVNLFVLFIIKGVNIFSVAGEKFASLKDRYPVLQDPLVTITISSLVIIVIVAVLLARAGVAKA